MSTTPLKPTLFVARAAQMTADSVGAIDQQIGAAAAIHVDPAALPRLAGDLANLNRTLAQWPQTLRAQVAQTLRTVLNNDIGALRDWPGVNQQDQSALLSFARLLQGVVGSGATAIGQLGNAVAPFRTAIDASVSTLDTDLKAVSDQLTAEQQTVAALEAQVRQQQNRIQYYRDHPWKLILDGLSIVGLIEDLNNIINADNQARAALSRLQQAMPQLQQLAAARGPLLSLSMAVTGLGGGVANMQTAIAQIGNTLNGIVQQPPLPAILAAQLGAIVEDLTSADGVINEMLTGS
jgi:hypothetical protein